MVLPCKFIDMEFKNVLDDVKIIGTKFSLHFAGLVALK